MTCHLKKYLLCLSLILTGCTEQGPILRALSSESSAIQRVMTNLPAHEVQILFTEILQSEGGDLTMVHDEFQVRDGIYHYPASTVKFPVALLALEKLGEDDRLGRYTRFQLRSEDTGSSFTNELIELFVVSDNQAFNRIFEFLGKDEINSRLRSKDLEARISHRLSTPDSDLLETQAISFSSPEGKVIVGPIPNMPIEVLALEELSKGVAYYEDGERIEKAFDFSEKNYLPLRSLHGVMLRLVLPDQFPDSQRFRLSDSDRQFVLNTMQTFPREAGYDGVEFPDGFAKFLVLGDTTIEAPDRFDIYNKSGWAYGYLTDVAYIVDHESNRQFVITASIHVNANRTFNDDNYEYEEIGVPFLAELGRQLIE